MIGSERRSARARPVEATTTRPVVFLHVPKTAGSSFAAALGTVLGVPDAVRGFDRSLYGDHDLGSCSEAVRRSIFADAGAMPRPARLVMGHFAHSTLRAAYADGQFVTVLREPVGRLLSHWLYWRQMEDDDLAGWDRWADQVRKSRGPLAGFLADPALAPQIDNVALRMLLWPHPLIPAGGFIDPSDDERLLRAARLVLRGFAYLDVIEHAGFGDRVGAWLGQPFAVPRINETPPMPAACRVPLASELTGAALQSLAERCRLDRLLWLAVAGRRLSAARAADLRERAQIAAIARASAILG